MEKLEQDSLRVNPSLVERLVNLILFGVTGENIWPHGSLLEHKQNMRGEEGEMAIILRSVINLY